jgi:hypothetical protein
VFPPVVVPPSVVPPSVVPPSVEPVSVVPVLVESSTISQVFPRLPPVHETPDFLKSL